MSRVIKVYEKDSDNFIANEKYFYSLNKAKKYFKGLIYRHKKELVREDERVFKMDCEDYIRTPHKRYKCARLEIEVQDVFESPNEIIEVRLEEIDIQG